MKPLSLTAILTFAPLLLAAPTSQSLKPTKIDDPTKPGDGKIVACLAVCWPEEHECGKGMVSRTSKSSIMTQKAEE